MKTEISTFCEDCLHILQSLPPALQNTAEDLAAGSDKKLLDPPLAALNDIRARLRSLVEKLANQHAYLLIFGPLKSGKSTLMNAVSGSYVSEVTSLPGYPCLVFVQNSEDPHFSVTRYNGRESIFADSSVLQQVIADSHFALADQIRTVETGGVEFDPRTHFTEAIRRVDIKIPVPSLAESSTVLVDTPGLYSRMNFGYDVLAREFRDTAACAVFVVKTDNLFLEQVFAEFNQLLDLFSRIFLVINVDSSKRDLRADGSLTPSAESQRPQAIIDAFKTLSMAGPLRKAYDANRVRIHAVDLLNAASAFLSNGNGESAGEQTRQKESFNSFLRDLTDYLNSSDYTIEFIRDSLRQGNALCDEVREVFESEHVRHLRARQDELATSMIALDERIAAVDRLLTVDWEKAFEKTRTASASRCADVAKAEAAETTKRMRGALDRWFDAADSIKALEQVSWNPILSDAARTLAEGTGAHLRELVRNPRGGAEPDASVMTDLHAVGFDLSRARDSALPALDEEDSLEAYHFTIKPEDLPVRKKFADWLLFRSAATVRRRLFGEDLMQEVPPEVKAKRLPAASREALYDIHRQVVQEKFPLLPAKFSERLLAGYVAKFRETTLDDLRELRRLLSEEREGLQAPFETHSRILISFANLQEQVVKVTDDLNLLSLKEMGLPASAEPNQPIVEAQHEPAVAVPIAG
jgi:hypothetical protein